MNVHHDSAAALRQDIREAWAWYSAPRFTVRQAVIFGDAIMQEIQAVHQSLDRAARSYGGALAFDWLELLLQTIGALEQSCVYCGLIFGLETWGVVRHNPLRRSPGSLPLHTDFSLDAYEVCCQPCALAKVRFNDAEWRSLLAALGRSEDAVRHEAVMLLGQSIEETQRDTSAATRRTTGTDKRAHRGWGKGTSPHPGARR